MVVMVKKVFKDDELARSYVFSNKKLPTVNNSLLYVLSRTNKDAKRSQIRQQIIWELTKIVKDVWNKADCCPYTRKHIVTLFEKNFWDKYTFLLREKNYQEMKILQRDLIRKIPVNIKIGENLHVKVDEFNQLQKYLLRTNLVQIIPHLLIAISRQ